MQFYSGCWESKTKERADNCSPMRESSLNIECYGSKANLNTELKLGTESCTCHLSGGSLTSRCFSLACLSISARHNCLNSSLSSLVSSNRSASSSVTLLGEK